MQSTLILISDYGTWDPAFTEVMLRLRALLPQTYIHPQSTPPFSTVNTGFWIAQISQTANIPIPPGTTLNVSLNTVTHPATFTDGSFNIPEGTLALAPGSTGHKNRFLELFYRGKSAAQLFNQARIEQEVTITTA